MNIKIAKNNKFETVGFHVYDSKSNQSIFNWGCSPVSGFYYIRELEDERNLEESVSTLIRLDERYKTLERFKDLFFTIGMDNNVLVKGKGVKFALVENEMESIKNNIKSTIESIIESISY